MGESGNVLTVKITDNIRIPAFSELEILAQVKGDVLLKMICCHSTRVPA